MKTAITAEEAKELYYNSENSAGRRYTRIILIKGNTMETVVNTKWATEENAQENFRKIDEADMIFNGGF